MKTSEALYAAADYIREHGWRKGASPIGGDGPRCIVEATSMVIQSWPGARDCPYPYTSTYGAIYEVTQIHPGDFNDHHCKSADDAIAALEIAADIAFAEGK